MPVGSKIDKFGVGEEIVSLRKGGMGYYDIANAINTRHPEIDSPLSHMAIKRYLAKERIRIKMDRLEEGEDLDESLRATFRERLYDLDYETHEIYSIMRKSLKKIIKDGNDMKIIKASKDILTAINQSKNNWMTLMQFGINEFKDNKDAQQKTTVNIDKLLIEISNELSPDARRELVNVVLSKEDKKMSKEKKKKLKEELEEYGKK